MGRPSEEQLLGLHRPLREVNVSFEPPPPPRWGLDETLVADGNGTAARRWRIGPRDLIALAAVAALVWLAVRDGDGLPFRSSDPAAPAAATSELKTTLAPDRVDRKRTSPSTDATGVSGPGSKSAGGQKDKNGSSGPGETNDGKDGDPPSGGSGGDEKTKPLVEATIPGVGTVTVDQPELPALPRVDAPTLSPLPDAGDILPETPTVQLP
jgi:hypothetical protein